MTLYRVYLNRENIRERKIGNIVDLILPVPHTQSPLKKMQDFDA